MSYRVEVEFPPRFVRFNSVQPEPTLGADGWWYFVVYGHADGVAESQQHLFRWKPNTVAERIGLAGETNARGSIGVHSAGAAVFSWDGSGSFPRLIVQDAPGLAPAPLDSRVDILMARVAELEAVQDGGGPSLSPRYVAALERLCALLGI